MYRIVYGETMPAWEKIVATKREGEAFIKKHKKFGDIIFSFRKIDYDNDEGPHSLIDAIERGVI